MLLNRPKLVIFTSKGACLYDEKQLICFEFSQWSEKNLRSTLEKIKEIIKNHPIYALLSDDLAYTQMVTFPKDESLQYKTVKQKGIISIPENFTKGFWNWQYAFKTDDQKFVQLFVLQETKAQLLLSLAQEYSLDITSINSFSYTVTQTFAEHHTPTIIIFQLGTLFTVSSMYIGFSVLSHIVTAEELKDTIQLVTQETEKIIDQTISQMWVSTQQSLPDIETLEQQFDVKDFGIRFEESAALEQSKNPEEETVLFIHPKDIFESLEKKATANMPETPEVITPKKQKVFLIKKKSNLLILLVFLLFAVVTLFVTVVAVRFGPQSFKWILSLTPNWQQKETTLPPTPFIEPTLNPTPEPTPIKVLFDPSVYSIQVLNGSGLPGEAGEMADFLETRGYQDIAVGNANNQNYQQTNISSNDKTLTKQLISSLSDFYSVASESGQLDNDTYEAVIIVGRDKVSTESAQIEN